VQTGLNLYPAEDVAIVVLINAVADAPKVTHEIERIILPRYAEAQRLTQTPPPAKTAFRPPNELVGEWSGTIRTWDRSMPLTVAIKPDGDVHVHVEGQMEALLNDAKWENNELTGRFAGTIPTSDASRWPHEILLSLRLRNAALSGMAAAVTTTEPVYFALTSYASLTKKVAAK
jgi:hypothetical protein